MLEKLAKNCPNIKRDFAYFKQTYREFPEIGTQLARLYHEWAWGAGGSSFPPSLFGAEHNADIYLKHTAAEMLRALVPNSINEIKDKSHRHEIELIKDIRPHAVITSNYDTMLELIFPELTPVVGQNIIRGTNLSVGEIFKIHGCMTDPKSLVITKEDYNFFAKKKSI